MQDLETIIIWIIPDPLGNINEIYANLTIMILLILNNFWIIQAELCLKGTFVKASFKFVTIFSIFMKILRQKNLY